MTFEDDKSPQTEHEELLRDRLATQANEVEAPPEFRRSISSRVAQQRQSRRRNRFGASVIAAAAITGIAAFGIAQTSSTHTITSEETTVLVDRRSFLHRSTSASNECAVVIWMRSNVGTKQVEDVRQRLSEFGEPTYYDKATTAEQFREFFKNEPETLDEITPADLPTRFELLLGDNDPAEFSALSEVSSVDAVDFSPNQCGPALPTDEFEEECRQALTVWLEPDISEEDTDFVREYLEQFGEPYHVDDAETLGRLTKDDKPEELTPSYLPSSFELFVDPADGEQIVSVFVARGTLPSSVRDIDLHEELECEAALDPEPSVEGDPSQVTQKYFDHLRTGELDQITFDAVLDLEVSHADQASGIGGIDPSDRTQWTFNDDVGPLSGPFNLLDVISSETEWGPIANGASMCETQPPTPRNPEDQVFHWTAGEDCVDTIVVKLTLNRSNQLARVDIWLSET